MQVSQIPTCSGFAAILLANLKHQRGLRTTGVGALGCRHEFWQPQSVVNLQKGERFVVCPQVACTTNADDDDDTSQCNMQLALFKSLRTMNRPVPVVLSYDINCQFSINLWKRFESLPDDLKDTPTPPCDWTHCIPKMHILGHIRLCQIIYSLNYIFGCGRTCGECIERMWALMNGIALST
jgi:bacterioferritin-associated ferredoxin